MAHIYMLFDFGTDEERAQQARHKLDTWRQAFRLDKKLQYKLDRPDAAEEEEPAANEESAAAKSNSKSKPHKQKKKTSGAAAETDGPSNVSLLIRLYFSNHEKLSEQRWLDRIPAEEPFKAASPKVLRAGEDGFDEAVKQFDNLD